jgi:N-acetyl-anhydromuramyl-L-alanine amidase AmpD
VRRAAALAAALAVLAAPAAAPAAEPQFADRFVAAHPRNYPQTYRAPSLIRQVVIHTTEGSYGGTVAWFRNPKARVSAHYVVGRGGESTQMVPLTRGAWHAGNGTTNRRSVGIEHEAYAHVAWTLTDAQYRASARIAAGVLRSRLLPIDRRTLIGHREVPHPWRRGRFGGYSGRTDPGPYWDWTRYLAYVRSYARGQEPPPRDFDLADRSFALGAVVRGAATWEAQPLGAVAPARVEFRVDGVLRDVRRQPPYRFGGEAGVWDTAAEENGRRRLNVRAVAPDGRIAAATTLVTVSNLAPPALRIDHLGFDAGQAVSGLVSWAPLLTGRVRAVEFHVDGLLRAALTAPPFEWAWDAGAETPGEHLLALRVVGPKGKVEASVTVLVEPGPPTDG